MANYSSVINKFDCGISDIKGTGVGVYCDKKPKDPIILCFTKPNVKVPLLTTVEKSFLTGLIQKEDIIVVDNIYSFVDETPDNETKTAESTGIMTKVMDHPVLWKITFDVGLLHYQALKTLESNSYFNCFFFDLNRSMFVAVDNDGWRGLKTYMLDMPKPIKAGKNNEYQMTLQLDRYDYDNYLKAIESSNLGFDPKGVITGYNDIDIRIVTPSAGLTFKFSVWAHNNNKQVSFVGLDNTDFKLQKATVVSNVVTGWTDVAFGMLPSVANQTEYTATLTTAMTTGEIYRIKSFDSVLLTNVILVEGVFLRSYNPSNDNYFEFVVA